MIACHGSNSTAVAINFQLTYDKSVITHLLKNLKKSIYPYEHEQNFKAIYSI